MHTAYLSLARRAALYVLRDYRPLCPRTMHDDELVPPAADARRIACHHLSPQYNAVSAVTRNLLSGGREGVYLPYFRPFPSFPFPPFPAPRSGFSNLAKGFGERC